MSDTAINQERPFGDQQCIAVDTKPPPRILLNVQLCPSLWDNLNSKNQRCAILISSGSLVTLMKNLRWNLQSIYCRIRSTGGLLIKWNLITDVSSNAPCSCCLRLEICVSRNCTHLKVLQRPKVQPGHYATSQVRQGEHMGWFLLQRLLQFRHLWSQRKDRWLWFFSSVVMFQLISANNVFISHQSRAKVLK